MPIPKRAPRFVSNKPLRPGRAVAWVYAVMAGQLLYLLYFFSLDLPNSATLEGAGAKFTRPAVLAISIPGLVPDSEAPLVWTARELLQFGNLAQRLPLLFWAVVLGLAAVSAGDLALRGIGLSPPDRTRPLGAETAWLAVEHVVLAWGIGTNLLALGTLALGLAGWMPHRTIATAVSLAALRAAWLATRQALRWFRQSPLATARRKDAIRSASQWCLHHPVLVAGSVAAALFWMISLLGAMLPATDFDVLAYHLQGPKEYFLAGRISFAPHNVYLNMPFATGMLSLLGMLVRGDWWWGGLVGQTLLAGFAPATAAAVVLLGRRCFGTTAGLFAGLIYLSTPWVYRITIIPHTENGLAFYLIAALLAARRAADRTSTHDVGRDWLVVGLLAGSAAACKYTALISTVLPCALGTMAWTALRRRPGQPNQRRYPGWAAPALLVLGVLLTAGPWYARNYAWTGNPTYPLLFRIFGGKNWSAEKNAKWEWAHRVALLVAAGLQHPPPGQSYDPADPQHNLSPRQFVKDLHNVTVQSDWLSPLLFPLAILAPAASRGRRSAR